MSIKSHVVRCIFWATATALNAVFLVMESQGGHIGLLILYAFGTASGARLTWGELRNVWAARRGRTDEGWGGLT